MARGKYLVENVASCLDCHSDHTAGYAFPIKPGTEGQGGYIFDKQIGFPGVVAAQNITPDPETGLGTWTDGEVLRATDGTLLTRLWTGQAETLLVGDGRVAAVLDPRILDIYGLAGF